MSEKHKNKRVLQLIRNILQILKPKLSFHYIAYTTLVALVVFSLVNLVGATTPNPGHSWSEVGDGVFAVTNNQTAIRTYTFPDANATVLTTNALVTVAQGGTGANTLTGILIGNGTSAFTSVALTAGQSIRMNSGGTAYEGFTPGTGNVNSISVATSNGFAGSSSGGSNPILTLSTTISGMLKGNGTAISAATDGSDFLSSSTGWKLNGQALGTKKTLGSTDGYAIGFLTNNSERMTILSGGNIGIGVTSPTAVLHLKAGTATAGTAPLKFASGVLLTTPETGAMEFDGTNLYFTPVDLRKTIAFTEDIASGYVPYTGATADVNLGAFDLTTTDLNVSGIANFTGSVAVNTDPDNNTSGFEYGNGYDPSSSYYYNERFRVNSFMETPHMSLGVASNFLLYSEDFSNAAWVKTSIGSVSANGVNAPNGSTTAENIPAGSASTANIAQTITNSTTGYWSAGVWARTQSGTATIDLQIDNGSAEIGTPKTVTVDTKWRFFGVAQNFSPSSNTTKTFKITSGTTAISLWGARMNQGETINSYRATTSSNSSTPTFGAFFNNTTIYGTLSGSASSAGYATYSNSGIYGGVTLSNTTGNAGKWELLGYVTLTYNSTYDYGHSWDYEVNLKEINNDDSAISQVDYEDITLKLKGNLAEATSTATFNSAVPTFSIDVSGATQLTSSDFAAVVYSTSTSTKVIRYYVKLPAANSHYMIVPINYRGVSYNSTLGISTSYVSWTTSSSTAVITTLPTPPAGQGSVVNGNILYTTYKGNGIFSGLLSGTALKSAKWYPGADSTTAIQINKADGLTNIINIDTTNGRMGIGTTLPTALLNLAAGTASAGTAPLKFTSGTLLTTPEDGSVEFDGTHYYVTVGSTRYQLDQQAPGGGMVYPGSGIAVSTGSAWGTSISGTSSQFVKGDGSLDSNTYLTTSSASSTYVPYTGATSAVDLGVHNLTVDTNTLFVDSTNHRVGIGTTSPTSKLYVSSGGGVNSGIVIKSDGTTGTYASLDYVNKNNVAFQTGLYDSGNAFFYMPSTGNNIGFYTNDLERMTIAKTGNVGIGTTSPTVPLDITGAVNISTGNLDLDNTTNANQYGVITKNGIRFIHNFNYGNNGTVTTEGHNLFIGENAGNFTMGSTANYANYSSSNVGIGYSTLSSNTTGYYNSAVGIYALYSNTTGYSNSAIGTHALMLNTTGYANSTVGNDALYNNTSGYKNSVIGSTALFNNTTGYSNSAMGYEAGRYVTGNVANTTSDYSIYLGANTKALADDDQNEIVIGYDATGAGSNTAVIGSSSLTSVYLGSSTPSARLYTKGITLSAGTATAGTAPLKFTSGTLLGTTEAGTMEFNGTHLYFTVANSGTRYQLDQQAPGGGMVYPGAGIPISTGSAWGTSISGTSSQFVKGDGSLDSNTYLTTSSASSTYVPYTGATSAVDLGVHNLTVDTNTLFVDSTNHFVGIGTTTPSVKLNVLGVTALQSGDADGALRIGADVLATTLSSNVRKLGRVTAPSYSNTYYYSLFSADSDTGGDGIEFGGRAGALNSSPTYISFATTPTAGSSAGNAERMRIIGNGNIGIGIASPTARLHLPAGTATAGTAPLKFTSGTLLGTTEAGTMEFNGTHLYFTVANSGTRYQLDQQAPGGGMVYPGAGIPISTGSAWGTSISGTSSQFVKGDGSLDSNTYLTSASLSGYVPYTGATTNVVLGANTLSTTSGLISPKLYPASDSTTAIQFNKADGTTNILNIDTTNSRVGIGTTSPSVKLEVAGQGKFISTTFPVLDIVRDTTTTAGGVYGGAKLERIMTGGTSVNGTGIGFYFKNPDSAGNSTFSGIFGSALSSVTDGSEVGDVIVSAAWQGGDPYLNQHLVVRATGATTGNVLVPNGNVGIGTTSPNQQLEITQNFRLPSTTYNSGNPYGIIYKGTNPFIHDFNYGNNGTVTTEGHNLFIGESAGNFTMGSTATLLSQSSNNIGIGYNSLSVNTTGYGNTAISNYSLESNTTGTQNSAIGYKSLSSNTTGSVNSAFGPYSLSGNTTGSNNSAFGSYSLSGNTTGILNVAFGQNALSGNTTGNYNSALGYNAGSFIADGSTSNTFGSNSLFLGSYSRALANNQTNQIVIGYNAIGNGSNTATIGNSSILRTYLRGVNLAAGTASAGTAPLKFTSGTLLGTPETGAMEFDGSHYYITIGSTRYQLDQQAPGGGMVYPGAGIPVSTGSAWDTSKTAPTGDIVGTTDTQDLTNKTYNGLSLLGNNTDFNSFVGYNTGLNIPSGAQWNSFFGYEAGKGSASTSYNYSNTGIGYQSLYSITVGSNNSALGNKSLYYNTSGWSNTAVGDSSLSSNTEGYLNVALGVDSLSSNITGYDNSAIGSSSMYSNTTGYYNIAIGGGSMYYNTTGNYNSATGYSSLSNNTTGNINSALGYVAGYFIADNSTPNTTSDYSLYLGAYTKALADNDQNEIVIGYDTTGNGSNTATIGNSSILRTYLRGVNLAGGTATAGTAPLKFTSGTLLGTTEGGAMEFDGSHLYFTIADSGTRYQLDQQGGMVYPGAGIAISTGSAWGTSISGTSSQFVKGDGSLDSNTYLTTSSASSTYVPYTGATTDVNLGTHTLASGSIDIATGNLDLDNTTYANQYGLITKNGTRFIHNFSYGLNGNNVTPEGRNLFIGEGAGNFTMGSDATYYSYSSNNIGVGYSTLSFNTTGYGNFAVGSYALYYNTTGYGNSAIGKSALFSNTEGFFNSALGDSALKSNTTGYRNISMGSYALNSNTTGSHNSALGYNTGRYIANGSTGNTTSDYSVYLGAMTKALADDDQNEIVIGYNATGAGSNTAVIGNSSVTSVYLGSSTAGARLYTNGVTLSAGTATAGTAPLKFTSGTLLGTTEGGAMEFDGSHLYFTIADSGTRYQLDQQGGMVYPGSGIAISTGSAWGTSISGTSSQFVKGDGSLDSNTYLTSASLSGYVPYTGATTNVVLGANTLSTTSGLISPKLYPASDSTTAIQFNKADGTTNILNIDTTNGRVGMGTTSPSSMLHIYDTTASGTFADGLYLQAGNDANAIRVRLKNTNSDFFINAYGTGAIGALANSIGFFASGSSTNDFIIGHTGTTSGNDIRFFTNNDYSDANELVITQGGLVGMGTSTPTGKLNIINTSEQLRIGYSSSVYYSTTIDSTGTVIFDSTGGASSRFSFADNLGIGTTSPSNILSLGGTTARTIWMERNTTAGTAGQALTLFSGGAYSGGTNLNGGDLYLKSGISTGTGSSSMHFLTATAGSSGTADNTPTEKMTILANGKVGIGNTNPSSKLTVTDVNSIFFVPNQGATGEIPAGTAMSTSSNFTFLGDGTGGVGNGVMVAYYNQTQWLSAVQTANVSSGYGNLLLMKSGGSVGVGTSAPTARLHLGAGSATAGTAPLKFTSGTLLTTAEAGAMEFDGTHYYVTVGSTRYQLDQQAPGGGMVYPGAGIPISTGSAWGTSISGTSSQFVKGDGSLDSNTYLTTSSASSTYVPYTGATTNVVLGANTLSTTSGLISPKLYPASDSTTAIQFNKADGTTNILNIDTTNGRVGIGTTSPTKKLEVSGNLGAGGIFNVNSSTPADFVGLETSSGRSAIVFNNSNSRMYYDSSANTFNMFPVVGTYDDPSSWNYSTMSYALTSQTLYLNGAGGVEIGQGGLISTKIVDTTTDYQNYTGSTFSMWKRLGNNTVNTLNGLNLNYGGYWSAAGTITDSAGIYSAFAAADSSAANFTNVYGIKTSFTNVGTGTITNQYGIYIPSDSVATNVYGISSNIASGTNKWNMYVAGTANNYFAGNVGIGTTTPQAALNVIGDVMLGYNSTGQKIYPYYYSATNYNAISSDSSGAMTFITGVTSPSERMRIDNSGYVGIGNASPATTLDITGAGGSPSGTPSFPVRVVSGTNTNPGMIFERSDASKFVNLWTGSGAAILGFTDTASRMAIGTYTYADRYSTGFPTKEILSLLPSGNVGVGVTNPTAKLHLKASDGTAGSASLKITDGTLLSTPEAGAIEFVGTSLYFTPSTTRKTIAFAEDISSGYVPYTGATTNVVLGANTLSTTSGLISPKLYPASDSTTAIQFNKADGTTNILNIDTTNGRVGIGTTSPNQQLEITKNFRLPSTTYNSGSPYGVIYKGTSTFIHDFTYGLNGNGITPSGYNTFLGVSAGNLTMGSTAAYSYQSSYNTGIGTSALYANTTGRRNTAVGSSSLTYNNTGYQNTAVGYSALYANNSGDTNTALGAQSLYSNTTGANNVGVGYYSLGGNVSGTNNIGIGGSSGYYISDGTTSNTAGTYSIFLGQNTKALADSQTNQIVIGYNSIGLGSNTVTLGNSSIITTALRGNIGIGTTSPDRLLHAEVSDAVTNAVTYAGRLSHITSGTSATSFGTGLEFELENASGTNKIASTIESVWETATDASEDSAIVFKNMIGGTSAAEVLRIRKEGTSSTSLKTLSSLQIAPTDDFTIYQNLVTPFTSVGSGAVDDTLVLKAGNVGIGNDAPGALLDIGYSGTTGGVIRLEGSSRNYVDIAAAADAGAWTMTLPASTGTTGQQLTTNGSGVTSWQAAGSLRSIKNVFDEVTPEEGLEQVLTTAVYHFKYKPGLGTGDSDTMYVGVMADEAPWAMHYNGTIVNPVNTLGYMILSTKALNEKIVALGSTVDDMNLKLKNLETILPTDLIEDPDTFGNNFVALFNDVIIKVEDGVAYMKGIATDTLKIGSSEKRTGITLYDEVTGDPYCISVADGKSKTTEGECGTITPEDVIATSQGSDLPTESSDSTDTTTDTIVATIDGATETTTTEESTIGTESTNITTQTIDTLLAEADPPQITLNGDSSITLTVGSTYEELGALATSDIDGTVAVIIEGSVDTNTVGTYIISYKAFDTNGNSATPVERIVNVTL